MSEVEEVQKPSKGIEVFEFNEPEIINPASWMEYMSCSNQGNYWQPPISPNSLAKVFRSAVHHESAIHFKVNVLASCFVPNRILSRGDFRQLALDYVVMANCYLERVENIRRRTMKFKPSLAKYTRRGIKPDSFWFVPNFINEHEFETDVFHVREVDIDQEIYGVPQYMSSLQSALLNENATMFRRRYFENGSHAGFILYMTDSAQQAEDVDNLRKALKDSKGPGNFRNLFMYAPDGKKDGLQLIPISEVAAKDEFASIKEVTRDDQLAAHRVPPALMGIVPKNSSGFGSIEQAAAVFARNEILPLMTRFEEFNEMSGVEVIKFDPYSIEQATMDSARPVA